MKINQTIYEEIEKHHGMITTMQFVSMGFSKQMLTKYVKEGLLVRVKHGVYLLPDAVQDDMYMMTLCSRYIVFSHDSALFLNGLSERTPFMQSITIPSNVALPKSLQDDSVCFYIKPDLYHLGMITKQTTMGNTVKCYDLERTICDFFRSRNRCDEETFISAIKNYAEYEKKNLIRLTKYAKTFKIEKELGKYLGVLL